jgi:hypothetical protein
MCFFDHSFWIRAGTQQAAFGLPVQDLIKPAPLGSTLGWFDAPTDHR